MSEKKDKAWQNLLLEKCTPAKSIVGASNLNMATELYALVADYEPDKVLFAKFLAKHYASSIIDNVLVYAVEN